MDITKTSVAVLESFSPTFRVFGVPYLFRDSEHYWSALAGPVGRELHESLETARLRGLCFYDAGARSFYTTEKPIYTPDDLAGLKIRVQESRSMIAMVDALGAAPTPIPWGELYTALQQGVVQGAENNPPSFFKSRHYEVCPYFTLDRHVRAPDILVIGTETWNRLSPEEQGWVQAAADHSREFQRRLWNQAEEEAFAALREAGVEIIEVDNSLFRGKLQVLIDEYREDPALAPLIDRITALSTPTAP